MSEHIEDGRVWAVDARTGEKRRVKPNVIKYSKHLSLAPSERAKGRSVKSLTEPARPKRSTRSKRVAEPAPKPEPDSQKPVAEPETTTPSENKEN